MKVSQKSIVLEALEIADNPKEVAAFSDGSYKLEVGEGHCLRFVSMVARDVSNGDWLVRDTGGNVHFYYKEIFNQMFYDNLIK